MGLTLLTARTVESNTGKKAARKIIAIAGASPMPNQSTANGIQAVGEMGRSS